MTTSTKPNGKNPCNLRKKSAMYRKKDAELILKELNKLTRIGRMFSYNIQNITQNKHFSYDKFKKFLEPIEKADCLSNLSIDESQADEYEYEIREAVDSEFRRLLTLVGDLEKAVRRADMVLLMQKAEYVTDEWVVEKGNKTYKCPMEYPKAVVSSMYKDQ